MTIVLQHQFWELEVGETGFGIGLSFSDVPEKLYVPYAAVRGFYDPSVNFELEFDVGEAELVEGEDDESRAASAPVAITHASSDNSDEAPDNDSDKTATDKGAENEDDGETAEVVSLDSFRNKK